MFERYTHQQPVADAFKRIMRNNPTATDSPRPRDAQRRLTSAIKVLEMVDWQPRAMNMVTADLPGKFHLNADELLDFEPDGMNAPILDMLTDTIERYVEEATGRPLDLYRAEQTGEYNVAAAAAYLELSEATVRHHIYVTGLLEGDAENNRITFTKATLDAFKALDVKPGPKSRKPING